MPEVAVTFADTVRKFFPAMFAAIQEWPF